MGPIWQENVFTLDDVHNSGPPACTENCRPYVSIHCHVLGGMQFSEILNLKSLHCDWYVDLSLMRFFVPLVSSMNQLRDNPKSLKRIRKDEFNYQTIL
jgi:hypothetical protein